MSPLRIKHLVQFFYGPASAQYFFLRSYFQVWIFFQICSRFLWEQKVAKESESFVATFGRKLSSITLFVHARYGARRVLCTGLMECGGVLVQNSKVQVTPTRGQKSNTQPLSRTLNLARCTPRKAPSSSHQPVWHPIWRYPTKRLSCQSNPGGWSCVVSGRSYVIAGLFIVSGCCANVPPLC